MQQGRVPFSACKKFTTAPGAAPGVAGKSGVRSGGKSQCTSTTTIDEDHDQMALYVPTPQPETACITSQLPVRSRGFLAGVRRTILGVYAEQTGGLRRTNWGFTRRSGLNLEYNTTILSRLPGNPNDVVSSRIPNACDTQLVYGRNHELCSSSNTSSCLLVPLRRWSRISSKICRPTMQT